MTEPDQASIQGSNKNPQPTQTYGQATVYASMPKSETSVNSSDSGKYIPPPKPQIVQESAKPTIPYSQSELSQYYSLHPQSTSMPNLTDVNAVKGSEAVYNYVKNQKSEPSQVAESISLAKSNYDESGLVSIYANRETKDRVTTETIITPEVSFENPRIETETTKTNYVRSNDNLYKLALASVVEAPAFIGLAFGSLAADISGKEVFGIKPGTQDTREQRVSNALTQRIGETPLDQLIQGNYELKGYTLPEKVVGLVAAGAGLYFTGGGNLKEDISNIVSRITKSGKVANESVIDELKNIKIPSVKTSTGIIRSEEVQTRGTAQYDTGKTSSTSTGLGGGGTSTVITPKSATKSVTGSIGIFEKTETPGKGTTGVFQGDVKKGISTSTPDLKNQKLEYISSGGGSKGSSGGGSKGSSGGGSKGSSGGGSKGTPSEGKTTQFANESIFSSKNEEVLKSFKTSTTTKTEPVKENPISGLQSIVTQKSGLLESIQKSDQRSTNLLISGSKNDLLSKTTQQQKEKQSSILMIKESNDLLNKSIQEELQKERSLLVLKQSSVQSTKQIQQQKEKQSTILLVKETNEPTTKITETTEKPPRELIILLHKKKKLSQNNKGKKGNHLDFLGAAPTSDIVGLTGRNDLTFGNNLTARLANKDLANAIRGKTSKTSLHQKITKVRSISKKIRI